MTNAIALFIALPVTILVAAFIAMASVSRRHDVADFDAPNFGDNKMLWGVTFALAVVYIMAGVPKLGEIGPVMNKFAEYGYSQDFMWLIGALEMAGAVLLLFRRTAWLAASGLSIIAGGSVYTHLAAGEYFAMLFPLACFAGLVWISFERFPLRRKADEPSGTPVTA
jgi:hypothetical protein